MELCNNAVGRWLVLSTPVLYVELSKRVANAENIRHRNYGMELTVLPITARIMVILKLSPNSIRDNSELMHAPENNSQFEEGMIGREQVNPNSVLQKLVKQFIYINERKSEAHATFKFDRAKYLGQYKLYTHPTRRCNWDRWWFWVIYHNLWFLTAFVLQWAVDDIVHEPSDGDPWQPLWRAPLAADGAVSNLESELQK